MNTIAIDCGASFIKGANISEGVIQKKIQIQAPSIKRNSDIFCPEQIENLVLLVRDMIIELGKGERRVRLCISNEMHGFLLTDKYGKCVTDYISWQREYGNFPMCSNNTAIQILSEQELQEEIYQTGMPLRAGLPSCNLLYLMDKFQIGDSSKELYFYTLGDYILYSLSGKPCNCHPTNAAATGLFDFRTCEWNKKLVQKTGGNRMVFPMIGKEAINFRLKNLEILALPAVGDQQAALLGADLEYDNEISFNIGTGAQVSMLTTSFEHDKKVQIRPYFNNRFLKTIPHIPSGRALNVFFRFIQDVLRTYNVEIPDDKVWEKLIEAVSKCDDSKLIVDLSFFDNAITDDTKGSIGNIDEYALTLSAVMYSVIRQMTDNFVYGAKEICNDMRTIRKVIYSGGLARKMSVLRDGITSQFPDAQVSVAVEAETLLGLYKYGQMML